MNDNETVNNQESTMQNTEAEIVVEKPKKKPIGSIVKILAFVVAVTSLIIGLVSNYNDENDVSTDSYNDNVNTVADSSKETEYFSVIEATDNGGVRFGLTLDDFIDNYNDILIEDYHLSLSDFEISASDTPNYNGVECDFYRTYKTTLGNDIACFLVGVESESKRIASVEMVIMSDYYRSFTDEENQLWALQRVFISQALIDEINSKEDFMPINDKQTENSENYGMPDVWANGVFWGYNIGENYASGETSHFQCYAFTKEQFENYISKNDVNVDAEDLILDCLGVATDDVNSKTEEKSETASVKKPATDFEVIGGSTNVYLISEKNYGVVCPYCGYDGGAMGTSDINYMVSDQYAGETKDLKCTFRCASDFKGGCAKFSDYSITVSFK